MSVSEVTLFFALLAVGAQAAVVITLVLTLTGRGGDVVEAVGPQAFVLALVVATVATLGSIYLSEVANFPPCRLCWYQRAFMYPLVPILTVAAWRRLRMWWVVVPVAAVGASISAYHILVENFPTLEGTACDPSNPCSLIWIRRFGYLTIPTMALTAFALIIVLALVAKAAQRETTQ